jgi:hypothetical protein
MKVRELLALIRIVFSKIFVKALFWLAILIVIARSIPWTRGIYDHIFPRPELRITVSDPLQKRQAGRESLCQRAAVVENRGNSTANEVYITVSVPSGQITKYGVFADHPYSVHPNTDVSRGYLMLALDRISPGGRVEVFLWGSGIEHVPITEIFAAVHDTGSAPRRGEPSSEEQIRSFVDVILANFEKSLDWAKENIIGSEGIRNHELTLGKISIPIPQIPSHLVTSTVALAFLAWLFLDTTRAAIIHGALVAGLWWLLVPTVVIPSWVMLLCTLPFFLILALRKISNQEFPLDYQSRWMLWLSALFLVFIIIDAPGFLAAARSVADCITLGYLMTMLSLEFLWTSRYCS